MSITWKRYYQRLPAPVRQYLKEFYESSSALFYSLRCSFNRLFMTNSLIARFHNLHLGCGDVRLNNCVNVDFRPTKAADLVMDLNNLGAFRDRTWDTVYSHAFFEHIYRLNRIELLKDIKRVLKEEGLVIFMGIPDFETIAGAYLKKAPGIIGPTFDLFNVYRYTHGDPEQYPKWWFEQLHKSLFDRDEIIMLLEKAGFTRYIIFRYCFGTEKIPVSLGFIAGTGKTNSRLSADEIYKLVLRFNANVNKKSLEILSVK